MVKIMKKIVDGNKACALSAYLFSEICAIYPITPSTPMASEIDVMSHKGYKNLFNEPVKVVQMQSEAGAAGAMHGALVTGALATTFTASQGLLLMIPNMYKMAGEMLPGVIHVAARSLATHALSIFGDHQDIYATRATGFCMLASASVAEAHHLAAVAHLAAIKASLPFLHFFDGFRTSHELAKIDIIDEAALLSLIDFEQIKKFKDQSLNVGCGFQQGLAQNEDVYFQITEARNQDYNQVPAIVADYMQAINKLTNQDYQPFNYYGDPNAQAIIIAMGSVTDTIKLVVDDLNAKGQAVGLIVVRLYRPFSREYLLKVLPQTVQKIAVLDRTKEAGSAGEPLYLDVLGALKDNNLTIVGGRYGLSSKNTTVADIYSVYQMLNQEPINNFTIGINDDVTHLSLPQLDYDLDLGTTEIKIYGFGSDGMVSASKDLLTIVGDTTPDYVQGYFQYDSKKSGSLTTCHLRFGKEPIKAPFYVTKPQIVVVTKDEYFSKYDLINDIKEDGILLISTNQAAKLDQLLPNKIKSLISERRVKIYTIAAEVIAEAAGIKGKISKIMETAILHLMHFANITESLTTSINQQFKNKGIEVVNANIKAVNETLAQLQEYTTPLTINPDEPTITNDVITLINNKKGDSLPVSALESYKKGHLVTSLTQGEKRRIAPQVAKWQPENCIQCEQCSLVCPHAAIRPFIVAKGEGIPLLGNNDYDYKIAISEADCTGCGQCINNCPGKGGNKALAYGAYDEQLQIISNKLFNDHINPQLYDPYSVKGSQLIKPKFEFSGACAGCGETPYLKLLSQLFGDKLVIANATGCSSIYGGSFPSTPYAIPWANSLFEDNAEFGYGMVLSYNNTKEHIKNIIEQALNAVSPQVQELFNKYLANSEDFKITSEIKDQLQDQEIPRDLKELLNYLPARSVWAIGGDGWAYDIGFGGIDHVLATNAKLKILVLDTEVYSNTGGQASKSSRYGQVAEFTDLGKRTNKKDLFKLAMSYPNCYVASVSLGANFMQTIKAFKEAEEHDGPAIIIAYAPCIEQGIKTGLGQAVAQQKLAVDCGYQILMRYQPEQELLTIDSREPNFNEFVNFLDSETRYHALKLKDPAAAQELYKLNQEAAQKRYLAYQEMAKKQG